MKEKIFKSYDIRGLYPKDFNLEDAYIIAQSLPRILGPGKVIVAYDVRKGSVALSNAVSAGLKTGYKAVGKKLEIVNIGLSTSPMFYFSVNNLKAAGGIMITASHNPKEYNGLKIVKKKAKMVGGLKVKQAVQKNKIKDLLPKEKIPSKKNNKPTVKHQYLKAYSFFLKKFLSVKKPLRVVLDFSNGAAGPVGSDLFKKQKNLTTFFINRNTDPDFKAHGPNPSAFGATSELAKKIKFERADLGVVFDADGDRAIVLDNRGRVLPSFVTAKILFDPKKPPFVADELVFKSLQHSKLLKSRTYSSKVGTKNIKNKMIEKKASVGAEFSGHFYFKKFFYSDSGLLAAIFTINQVSGVPNSLASFKDKLPQQKVVNKNIKLNEEKIQKLEKSVEEKFKGKAKIEKREGVTLDFGDGWINIRKSNTEPLVRLTSGAKNTKECQKLIGKVVKLLRTK